VGRPIAFKGTYFVLLYMCDDNNIRIISMAYDVENIFAKILREEIPCDKVFENDHVLAFRDVQPQAPVHVLVIPKGAYTDMDDFSARATDTEIVAYTHAVGQIARELGIKDTGYRILSNCGVDSGQEVPHLHIHILGGKTLGPIVSTS